MIKRCRRAIAGLLIPFVVFWSIMLPRQAYAFAPVGAAPIAIVGTLASGVVVPLVVGATIAGIAYWVFKDVVSLDQVRVPAVDGAGGVVPAPTGVPATAAPVSSGGLYSCPQSGTQCSGSQFVTEKNCLLWGSCGAGGASCNWYVAGSESCAGGSCNFTYYLRNNNPGPGAGVCTGTSSTSYATGGTSSITCPVGYSNVSGVCTLSNSRLLVADGNQDFTRSGTTLSPVTGDLAGGLSGTRMTTNSANDTVVVVGKDSAGNAMQGKIVALSGGGSQVELKTQKVDAAGVTYVETQTFKTSSAGDVVSASQTATASSLSYDPVGKTYTETAAPGGSIAANPSSSGQQSIQFPSDYARQGEAASAAQSISNTLGPKLDKLVETSAAPVDVVVPDPSGYTDFGNTFTGLLGWQLPGHTSQCPTGSFTSPWNTSYTIDSHCQLISSHWTALQSVMAVVWTIAALFVVLRA